MIPTTRAIWTISMHRRHLVDGTWQNEVKRPHIIVAPAVVIGNADDAAN